MSLNFTYISPSVTELFGMSVEEAMQRPAAEWNTPDSYEKLMNLYIDEMEREKQRLPGDPDRNVIIELEQVRKDGTVFPVEIKMSFMRDADGKAIGIVGITRDITERKEAEADREMSSQIDAIICDLSMPGKSGLDVSQEILKINPAANIILSSGMIEEAIQQKAMAIGIKEVLRKPYSAQDLLIALDRVLQK